MTANELKDMEFKGTKGKWERITTDYDLNQEVFLEDTEQSICKINSTPHLQLYDALLISKAPEMLEMLKRVLNNVDFSSTYWGSDSGLILNEEIKELIKQATEL